MTHDLASVIFVAVCFHIPYDLVTEQLRDFGGFKYEPLYISYEMV